jgi:hypothetical protein
LKLAYGGSGRGGGEDSGAIPGDRRRIRTRLLLMLAASDLYDHLDTRAACPMMRVPQTVKHPALVTTLIACARMADPALPA